MFEKKCQVTAFNKRNALWGVPQFFFVFNFKLLTLDVGIFMRSRVVRGVANIPAYPAAWGGG